MTRPSALSVTLLLLLLTSVLQVQALVMHPEEHPEDGLPDIPTANQTFAVNQPGMITILPSQVQYSFEESTSALQIFNNEVFMNWQTPQTPSLSFGNSHEQVWVRLRFFNPQPTRQTWLLEVRWNNLYRVDFYQAFRANSESSYSHQVTDVAHYQAGVSVPPEQLFMNNSTILFPVVIDAQSHGDVLLQVQSSHLLFAPLYLWPEEDFNRYQLSNLAFYVLALGMIMALFFYNVAVTLFTRDRSYFFYCCYMASVLLYLLAVTGIGHYMIWGGHDWWSRHAYDIGINACFLFATLFVRYFLDLRQHSHFWLNTNDLFVMVWSLNLLLLLVGFDFSARIVDLLALVSLLASLVMTATLIRRRIIAATYFMVAWITLIVTTFISLISLKGYLPYTTLTQYSVIVGFVTESILLAVALAARINEDRTKRDSALEQAYQLQIEIGEKREAALNAQARMLEIEQTAKRELELKVSERTRELQQLTRSLEQANRELANLSVTDALTGVANRRYFDLHMERELQRARRNNNRLALVLVDIDHFKQVNDTWGHPVGDICLRWIANQLSRLCQRSSDCIARYGGEEFALIFPDANLQSIHEHVDRLRADISGTPLQHEGLEIRMSISAGIAISPLRQTVSVDVITCQADTALYTAKNSGRNQVVMFRMDEDLGNLA
ncbi:sensor domain-containing diguanylate cyclase [Parathalassolituus penaei]|uniref:diguanylate cyclase n=1 Tax=Parathalassolituus penaei TaxID=2997323 RepID=A0A9X3ISW1_9GAMM|nr:diguanylate cyclase [Parathalassolituus penaei]MCY0965660.1 diguanylate cyclase [Parathalassolituus penaei]